MYCTRTLTHSVFVKPAHFSELLQVRPVPKSKLLRIVVAVILQAAYPSCHPTNRIKALMDVLYRFTWFTLNVVLHHIYCLKKPKFWFKNGWCAFRYLLELTLLDENTTRDKNTWPNRTSQTLLNGKHTHEIVLLFDMIIDVICNVWNLPDSLCTAVTNTQSIHQNIHGLPTKHATFLKSYSILKCCNRNKINTLEWSTVFSEDEIIRKPIHVTQ